MHGFTTLVTQGLLLAPLAALAAPSSVQQPDMDAANSLSRRQDEWHGDDDGNVIIRMSDKQVNFGNIRIGYLTDLIRDRCSDISCGSNGADASHDMEFVDSRWYLLGKTVLGHADGFFVTSEPATRDNLFEIAMKALEEVEETEEWLWHDNPTIHSAEHGKWIAEGQDNEPNREHWYPEELHLSIEDGEGGSLGRLDLTFSIDSGEHDGFCSTLGAAGGAINGLVSGLGFGGPALSLLSLVCLATGGD